ncbi:MAG TPA: hypothetical protein VGH49_14960 [Xanthobacteraceae bacterium]
MSHKRLRTLAAGGIALSLAGVLCTASPVASATSYDGLWSVVIVTQKGVCDRSFRYPVRITNASLVNAGDSAVSISGKVRNNGELTVTVSNGSKNVTGSGRLSATAGEGSWSGGDCAGTWEAERRSS